MAAESVTVERRVDADHVTATADRQDKRAVCCSRTACDAKHRDTAGRLQSSCNQVETIDHKPSLWVERVRGPVEVLKCTRHKDPPEASTEVR